LIDKDRAIAEGKLATAELIEAQRNMSEVQKRNDALEHVSAICMATHYSILCNRWLKIMELERTYLLLCISVTIF
jgi:hypothetical protein